MLQSEQPDFIEQMAELLVDNCLTIRLSLSLVQTFSDPKEQLDQFSNPALALLLLGLTADHGKLKILVFVDDLVKLLDLGACFKSVRNRHVQVKQNYIVVRLHL